MMKTTRKRARKPTTHENGALQLPLRGFSGTRPDLTLLDGGRTDRAPESPAVNRGALDTSPAGAAAPGSAAAAWAGRQSERTRNDVHCEPCGKPLKKRPAPGQEAAWTELDEPICDVATRRLRTAYLCEACGWHLWELAA